MRKSPSAVAYTKVKGHATDKDIRNGVSTVEDKEANDEDDAADEDEDRNEE